MNIAIGFDTLSIEMTLVSGRGLRLLDPGGLFRATFHVHVQEMP